MRDQSLLGTIVYLLAEMTENAAKYCEKLRKLSDKCSDEYEKTKDEHFKILSQKYRDMAIAHANEVKYVGDTVMFIIEKHIENAKIEGS